MLKTFFSNTLNRFRKLPLAGKFTVVLVLGAAVFLAAGTFGKKTDTVTYQTGKAETGTLVVSVSGSGQVSTANNGTVSTLATGVVSKLYVKDGDEVKAGDKLAEVELDLQGQQNANQALSSYQSAKNNLESAKANMFSMQASMFTDWDKFMQIAQNSTYQNEDGTPNHINRSLPEFHIANDNWLASEAKYKNQQSVVTQAQTALSAAWSSYQQTSPVIYAPISGTVTGFSLQEGSVIVASTNTSNSAQSATKIASIKTKALPMVSVNLTEIDVPKVSIGDKATITFDAFSDKTFTGKVISIDTAGTTSSGVTTYPTVIRLDTESEGILPSMAASANIITDTKHDVLIVPSSSIKTLDGGFYVLVMKNGKTQQVTVETGASSDTQTEIVTGLKEGDEVVTATINTGSSAKSTSTSPFGLGGGVRMGTGGGTRNTVIMK